MSRAGKNSLYKTYYEILAVKEDASFEEIKAGYKLAVLKSHPDKLSDKDGHLEGTFLNVQQAWEVLGDPQSRATYDQELNASRIELLLASEVTVDDMTILNSNSSPNLVYPCRCGDFFSIGSDELEEMGFFLDEKQGIKRQGSISECTSVVIPCFSCSLKICLVLGSGS